MPKIVIVDDEVEILEPLEEMLLEEGFSVRAFSSSIKALAYLKHQTADLVVFDIKIPELNGIELLQRVREIHPSIPTIFLSSKNEDADQLIGFSAGADDYVGKPFTKQLLIFRIKSVLRRYAPAEQVSHRPIIAGDLSIDRERHLVSWQEKALTLTVTECMILISLAERPGAVKKRSQLMDACYEGNVFVSDRTIDSHVRNIRSKIRAVDQEAELIKTVHGLGYKLVV
ncbi:response regulator transcription factor [Thalassobacter stenotrophicus]|uniref:response regulator transcription factor n=1 Tax=Thalassobacter stenotrophicus TaxID=266809 RepID=UPI000D5CF665|nr:response regulator transcription factor [Thalassobacter stenotrophicus]PVZ50466.1 two-component system response regulator [Thalassobacter stenotrophicus]